MSWIAPLTRSVSNESNSVSCVNGSGDTIWPGAAWNSRLASSVQVGRMMSQASSLASSEG